jgi:cytochrome c553
MKKWTLALAATLLVAAAVVAAPPQKNSQPPMPWAYGFDTPPNPGDKPPAGGGGAPPDNTAQKHVDGSSLAFTAQQIANGFGPADWFPADHPQMPDIVAHGKREAMVVACALCHYPNGKGRPENASVAGLPYTYIVQTLNDFKNGGRKSADPRKGNAVRMAGFAKGMSDDEIKAAALYFSSMKWTPWIKVVETDTVPKTKINGGMYMALEGNDKEPIAGRIIEVPVNGEATEQLRDPHSSFVAYVPKGSVAKGMALVTTGGNGKTLQCGVCHGADLQGLGPVPGIAGRSPSYLARQLYDMQNGFRNGVWTDLMKPVVAKLSNDDIVDIVAYVTSRPAGSAPSWTPPASSTSAPSAAAAAAPAAASGNPELLATGKARFNAYGCVDCHGLNGEGSDQAPDLIGTHLNGDQIAAFLNKPSADAKAKGMPDIPPTSPDLQPLVAYVLSLKKTAAQ